MERPKVRIDNIRGYDGLPNQFIVQSQYGYLCRDSFGPLRSATIFRTKREAEIRLFELYPEATFER